MQVLIFRHPKLFKDVFFAVVLIVIQPLLGAVLLHSLCCNTHTLTVVDVSVVHPAASTYVNAAARAEGSAAAVRDHANRHSMRILIR